MKPSKILIFMLIVSTTFNLMLTAMGDTATASNIQVVGEEYQSSDVGIDDPNPVYGFLGPLMVVWNAVVKLLKFLDAPYQFLNAIGAPWEVKLLLGLPWRIAWIWAIISFIRGYEG